MLGRGWTLPATWWGWGGGELKRYLVPDKWGFLASSLLPVICSQCLFHSALRTEAELDKPRKIQPTLYFVLGPPDVIPPWIKDLSQYSRVLSLKPEVKGSTKHILYFVFLHIIKNVSHVGPTIKTVPCHVYHKDCVLSHVP